MSKKLVVMLVGFEKVKGDAPSVLEENVDNMLSDIPEEIDTRYYKAEVENHDDNDGEGSGSVLVQFTVPEVLLADEIDPDDETGPNEEDYTSAADTFMDKFFGTMRNLHEIDITVESTSIEDDDDDDE